LTQVLVYGSLYFGGQTLTTRELTKVFKNCGALMKGHFVYTSGLHGDFYFNKDAIYPHTEIVSDLCISIAYMFKELKVDTVISPAVGGVILANRVADFLSMESHKQIHAIYADKSKDGFEIRRGYPAFISGKNVLVVEDVVHSGDSLKKVVNLCGMYGGNVIGVSCIATYEPEQWFSSLRLQALYEIPRAHKEYTPSECQLCKNKVPINTEVGHSS
jgi:orotate phosphoribosyltransferase